MLLSPQSVQIDGQSIGICRQETADADFLFHLYCTVRGPDFAVLGWSEQTLQQLPAAQYRLQAMQYACNYPGIEQWIVELALQEIGRSHLWPHILSCASSTSVFFPGGGAKELTRRLSS